jgi:hypothetical protein
MNRDEIITKLLDEFHCSESSVEDLEPGTTTCDAEYIRDVFLPEMLKRLPEGEITTCEELQLDVECCSICHGFYPHYDMYMVELPDGRKGWICCAVRGVLFPETAIAADSPEALEFMRMLGGNESKGQGV